MDIKGVSGASCNDVHLGPPAGLGEFTLCASIEKGIKEFKKELRNLKRN